jgi:hypothetical protein
MKHDWRKALRRRDFFVPTPREGRLFLRHIIPEDVGKPPTDQLIEQIQALLQKEARAWRQPRLIVKNPRLSIWIRPLRHAFPQAYFVHIIRDGRAVALSLSQKKREQKEGESRASRLRRLAEHWREVVAVVIRTGSEERNYLEMRYEDFCTDIHSHIARVLSFAGLDERKMPWHRLPERLTPTNDRWLEACPAEEKALLEEVLGDDLRILGYA